MLNKNYGEWTVLGPSLDKKYYSLCKCSCGTIKDVHNSALRLGKSKSCGHNVGKDTTRRQYAETDKKVLGEKFGRLKAVKRVGNQGLSRYLCECDCGNKATVKGSDLISGKVSSCGCVRKESSARSMEKIMVEGHEKLREAFVGGTNIYSLKSKLSKSSTTGVKGVSKLKNGKYRAYINLRRKQKYLGVFDTLEDAKEARLEAEKKLYSPILDKEKEDN